MYLGLRRCTIDGDNNDDESIIQVELANGAQLVLVVGDFVWIRHNQCIDTPSIIHRIATGNLNC